MEEGKISSFLWDKWLPFPVCGVMSSDIFCGSQGWEESRDSLDRDGIEAILRVEIGVVRHIYALLMESKSAILSLIDSIPPLRK